MIIIIIIGGPSSATTSTAQTFLNQYLQRDDEDDDDKTVVEWSDRQQKQTDISLAGGTEFVLIDTDAAVRNDVSPSPSCHFFNLTTTDKAFDAHLHHCPADQSLFRLIINDS